MLSMKPAIDFNSQRKNSASAHIWAWLISAIVLGVISVGCAVFYVRLYVQQVQNGYQLSKLAEENEIHSTVQRKLTLEWSRFRDPVRLEEIGRNQFGMAPPRADQKILVR
jgi:cell division protein FtsL